MRVNTRTTNKSKGGPAYEFPSTPYLTYSQRPARLLLHVPPPPSPKIVFCWKTLEIFMEAVHTYGVFSGRRWKTSWKMCTPTTFLLGRRKSCRKIKNIFIFFKDLRLPGQNAVGVHIFQDVFQRLPAEIRDKGQSARGRAGVRE